MPARGVPPPTHLYGVLPSPSPLPLLCLSPSPPPPLLPLPPRPLAPQIFWACCGISGVWPLCGPPLGVWRIIRVTMSRAFSSGVPLPPNGEGAPTPTPVSPFPSSPPPSPSLCLALGRGLRGSWGFPPISWFSPRMKGVRACSGGGPPSPSGWVPDPLSPPRLCTPCAGGARCSGAPLGALDGFWGGGASVHAMR